MQLSQFGDTIQNLRHEGHNLARVHFGIGDVLYMLKSVDVTPGQVIFRLQAESRQAVHEGFLGVSQKSSNRNEKT